MDIDCRSFVVDLKNKTCQCHEFQLDQFIYAHIAAAYGLHGLSVYNYVTMYYKKEEWMATYASVMHPIGTHQVGLSQNKLKITLSSPQLCLDPLIGQNRARFHQQVSS